MPTPKETAASTRDINTKLVRPAISTRASCSFGVSRKAQCQESSRKSQRLHCRWHSRRGGGVGRIDARSGPVTRSNYDCILPLI